MEREASVADWLSQTHLKNYDNNFSLVVIRFFSEVEIPIMHSSLYHKTHEHRILITEFETILT